MRELVIVIADLYLPRDAPPALPARGTLAAFDYVGRFGERGALPHGWRAWLAEWLGHAELARVAPAQVAAAALGPASGPQPSWIATPLHLSAGLSRVHLERHGILRLGADELAALAAAFHAAFAGSGLVLTPLPGGDLLLAGPGIAPAPTVEPARFAGGAQPLLPSGPAAGPLRRLTTEIEMWLHTAPLNAARIERGAAPVTTLWLWGGGGEPLGAATPAAQAPPPAWGSDAYVSGLWHFLGARCQRLPPRLEAVLATAPAPRALLVADLTGQLPADEPTAVGEALARLEERYVAPALQALRRGDLARLTLIANDTRLSVRRGSGLRRWRRPRGALESFA